MSGGRPPGRARGLFQPVLVQIFVPRTTLLRVRRARRHHAEADDADDGKDQSHHVRIVRPAQALGKHCLNSLHAGEGIATTVSPPRATGRRHVYCEKLTVWAKPCHVTPGARAAILRSCHPRRRSRGGTCRQYVRSWQRPRRNAEAARSGGVRPGGAVQRRAATARCRGACQP